MADSKSNFELFCSICIAFSKLEEKCVYMFSHEAQFWCNTFVQVIFETKMVHLVKYNLYSSAKLIFSTVLYVSRMRNITLNLKHVLCWTIGQNFIFIPSSSHYPPKPQLSFCSLVCSCHKLYYCSLNVHSLKSKKSSILFIIAECLKFQFKA